jgi:two-component system nitrogen regulation response regulator GlnG
VPLIDAELVTEQPPLVSGFASAPLGANLRGRDGERGTSLSAAVERHLADLFQGHGDTLPPPGLYHRVLRELEYPLISAALAATRGNQIKAAELLGLNRNTLRKKVRDLDIRLMRSPR